jgi:hypothetical protein
MYISPSYQEEEEKIARKTESTYGLVSGCEFLILSILFVVLFTKLTRLLRDSEFLNSDLKSQRKELKLFWLTVFFGYGLRCILQFLYGQYWRFIPQYYTRWMLYYISNPVMDVPNVLYVYWKHAVTFKVDKV